MAKSPFISTREAAEMMGVQRSSVTKLIKRGELVAWKISRSLTKVDTQSVTDFLERARIQPDPRKPKTAPESKG